MNEQKLLEEFGKILMNDVRDWVILINEQTSSGEMGGKGSNIWYEQIETLTDDQKGLLLSFAKRSVDYTLHHFLWMLQQHENLKLIIKNEETGEEVNLEKISDGLCGELYTEEGWIERFSQYPPTIE